MSLCITLPQAPENQNHISTIIDLRCGASPYAQAREAFLTHSSWLLVHKARLTADRQFAKMNMEVHDNP